MSLRMTIIAVSILATTVADAQLFTDQGLMSGSGLSILPTSTTTPSSEMQLQYTRVSALQRNGNSLDVFGLNCGFSQNLEGYVRLTSEDIHAISSQSAYAFGGKFRLPILLPVIRRAAVWFESTVSDLPPRGTLELSSLNANRGGLTVSVDSNGFRPCLFAGMTQTDGSFWPLAGAGLTVALSHSAQVAGEFVHGYLSQKSSHIMLTGSMRVFSNISVHVSPGRISDGPSKSWMVSVGLSLSSADIDYHQIVVSEVKKEDFVLPSIDELEKQSQQEKK